MEYAPLSLLVACSVCPVGPVIVTLAFGKTAPDASVTIPEMLPVETEVWANATEDMSSADRATNASRTTRAAGREEFKFDIDTFLRFGNVHLGVSSQLVVHAVLSCVAVTAQEPKDDCRDPVAS